MRRRVLAFVLPLFLFAVQCEDGSSTISFTKREDDLLLDRVMGEWAFEDGGEVTTLRICEDVAPAIPYCSRSSLNCSPGEGCHDIQGGDRGRDEKLYNGAGCDCVGGRYGGVVKGTLENESEQHLLEGTLRPWLGQTGTYEPTFRMDLSAPAGTHAVTVTAIWEGETLAVTGSLPPRRPPGSNRLPSYAFVDASPPDRILSAAEPQRFRKTKTRSETCGAP